MLGAFTCYCSWSGTASATGPRSRWPWPSWPSSGRARRGHPETCDRPAAVRRRDAHHRPRRESSAASPRSPWGAEIYTLPTPFSARATRLGGVTVSHEYSRSSSAPCCCARRCTRSSPTPKSASPCRRPRRTSWPRTTWGIPVSGCFSLIWAISAAGGRHRRRAAGAVSLIDINLGFIGLKAFAAAVLGGFGSIPGALVGGVTIGLIELFAGAYLPQGVRTSPRTSCCCSSWPCGRRASSARRAGRRS